MTRLRITLATMAAVSLFAAGVAGVHFVQPAEASVGALPSDAPLKMLKPPPLPSKADKLSRDVHKGFKGMPGKAKQSLTGCGAAGTDACYYYEVGKQLGSTNVIGSSNSMTVKNPYLAPNDFHTLVEDAVQSSDTNQIVEVGATKDPTTFGDSLTHLFVYHWVNGHETSYNGNFTDNAANPINVGAALTSSLGTEKLFTIVHQGTYPNGAWWIGYDTDWVGYFSDSLWYTPGPGLGASVANFGTVGVVQQFAEIAAKWSTPANVCTDTGEGALATTTTGSKISSQTFTYVTGTTPAVSLSVSSTATQWNAVPYTAAPYRSFRFGGGGGC